MDNILDAPTNSNKLFRYAGFWIRVAAYLVDYIVLLIFQIALSYMLLGDFDFFAGDTTLNLLVIIVGVVYFAGMESSSRQGTLGKIAFNLKVIDKSGNPISFMNAMGRYFAKIISALLLCIGFLMVAWDDKKQGLHDKIAETLVIEA